MNHNEALDMGDWERVMAVNQHLRHDMRFPTMWYVRPAKAQNSLRISAV